jgi:hypothetical protein
VHHTFLTQLEKDIHDAIKCHTATPAPWDVDLNLNDKGQNRKIDTTKKKIKCILLPDLTFPQS